MILSGRSRMSRLDGCVEAAAVMGIQRNVASATIEEMVEALRANYDEVCDMAGMTSDARRSMMGRQFLNPYIF
jgi:hypothetical protein